MLKRFNKLNWLYISLLVALPFMILSRWYDWAIYVALIGWIYPVILGLTLIIYAWIINPWGEKSRSDKND